MIVISHWIVIMQYGWLATSTPGSCRPRGRALGRTPVQLYCNTSPNAHPLEILVSCGNVLTYIFWKCTAIL